MTASDDGDYRTDLTEMQRLIDKATAISQTIEQRLDEIDRRVAALHVNWSGQSATAHSTGHAIWARAARDLHAVLESMRDHTDRARTTYTAVVQTNQRMWPA
jgi:WXG100 family type VII secretion target